jgi:hypothetical protein
LPLCRRRAWLPWLPPTASSPAVGLAGRITRRVSLMTQIPLD